MYLLIPAAGSGRRMGGDRNKLLLPLLGKPLLAWTLLAAKASQSVRWVGVIGQPGDFQDFREIVLATEMEQRVHLIPGGATRQESVFQGLQGLPAKAEHLLIHDGARCLVTPELIDRCAAEVLTCPGLVTAIPVKDTIKIVKPGTTDVINTPDRSHLWTAQTPQGFEVETLTRCHQAGKDKGWEVTDDAMLFERSGLPVKVVEGEETNLKVTTVTDLVIAEFILKQRSPEILQSQYLC